jgi:hypothetical protein
MNDAPEIPKELDAIVDKVLAYRPKPKSDAGKARKRKAAKAKLDNQRQTYNTSLIEP